MNELFSQSYHKLFDVEPPQKVIYEESSADIFSEARGFMGGFDLTMQIQVGCPCACLFCYVRTAARLAPKEVRGSGGSEWGFVVKDKLDVPKKLNRHICKRTLEDKNVYWSGVTDPYAAKPEVTKAIWKVLAKSPKQLRPRRIVTQTRLRPDRDVQKMTVYEQETETSDGGPAIVVSYSLTSDDDGLARSWERVSPPFEKRMKCIRRLWETGIWVVPTFSPFGIWKDLHGTLTRLKDLGIPYITTLFFKEGTRSANTPKVFLEYMRKHYPQVLEAEWQNEMLYIMREVFGEHGVLVGKEGFESLVAPHEVRFKKQ